MESNQLQPTFQPSILGHFAAVADQLPQQGGFGRESEPHWEEEKQKVLQEEGTEDVKAT